ncbi:unnamed protein product [Moneuplotes crassus]|uniref:Palmitoyl-protein thioesterase 1 n=1 Tax=Euplotes crassus TaxID=5936 RepID=A0AAD1XSI7_EUPCR|nr:unnamed protein product [Moneuplotes crassus]
MKLIVFMVLIISFGAAHNFTNAPVLVIHGINDDCDYGIVDEISTYLDTYAECYPIGGDEAPIVSIFYNINHQGRILCERIHQDDYLKDGNFSIMGVSQGSIVAKYIIEYCPLEHPVRNLVTFGGPHMGVSFVPTFPKESKLGSTLAWIVNKIVYYRMTQYFLAPADFWRDPNNQEGYFEYSRFLAEANNEKNFDQRRKDQWLKLQHATFVMWDNDTTIIPKESSWWGMYSPDLKLLSRFETDLYKNDLIGLKTLEESGRAEFISIPGDHMEYTRTQINLIVGPTFIK